jgi:hypothetical protein
MDQESRILNPARDAGFRDAGFLIRDSRFRIRDSRFRIRDSGFAIQDQGFRIQDSRFRIRDQGLGIVEIDVYQSISMIPQFFSGTIWPAASASAGSVWGRRDCTYSWSSRERSSSAGGTGRQWSRTHKRSIGSAKL